jgi:hypothetical protein
MSLILKEIQKLDLLLFPEAEPSLALYFGDEKNQKLNTDEVIQYLNEHKWLRDIIDSSDPLARSVVFSIIHTGQAGEVLVDPDSLSQGWSKWNTLMERLKQVELFYQPIGGLIGYHREVLVRLAIHLGLRAPHPKEKFTYEQPPRIDIRANSPFLKQTIVSALNEWEKIAFIMPIGGAGERLGLEDEQGHPLPAAFLSFEGKTLLEGLIVDIEAIESLIYESTGKTCITPIALMTSDEKNNHVLIEQFLKDHQYFGRPQDSIRLFRQKMVPVVTEEGMWVMNGPLEPVLKPGGHGAIWRSCDVHGVLDWFENQSKTHALVRQVNNPMAATDVNFLAVAGYGLSHLVSMVLLTCERLVHSSEGVNVLRLRHGKDSIERAITNVEYTDFSQEGIEDAADEPGSIYSAFSSNTNLFLIEIAALRKALVKNPFPGSIINLKSKASVRVGDQIEFLRTGRLESMMQNIADSIETTDDKPLAQVLLFAERAKVISVAKKKQPELGFALETPVSAFYDRQKMFRDLLASKCSIHLPMISGSSEYFHGIPPIVLHLDPRLGPVHSLIAKRLQGGTLSLGSFLQLHLQNFICRDLYLDGALDIEASDYRNGYVYFNRVSVVNAGWDLEKVTPAFLWQRLSIPHKKCKIILEGKSAFIANQVVIESNQEWKVADGRMLIASAGMEGEVVFEERDFDFAFIQRLGFENLYLNWLQSLQS